MSYIKDQQYLKNQSVFPVRTAGENIALSPDFRSKWVGKPLSIAVTDTWHGSGTPQRQLASMLFVIAASSLGTSGTDALMVLQDSPGGIECARLMLDADPTSTVVYDSSGTFASAIPAGSFEMVPLDANGKDGGCTDAFTRYSGSFSEIPPETLAFVADIALSHAESELARSFEKHGARPFDKANDVYWRQRFDSFRSVITPSVLQSQSVLALDVLSCRLLHVPTRDEFGLEPSVQPEGDGRDGEDPRESEISELARQALRDSGLLTECFPLPERESAYIDALRTCARAASALRLIWERACENIPFPFEPARVSSWESVPRDVVESLARATGAYVMMEAYLDGTPIEDILA